MPVTSASFTTYNDIATQHLGALLGAQCHTGDCIMLKGEVGAGKTTFARGFIQALQATQEEILSPTFTLVQTYFTRDNTPVSHFDLYRLLHAQEIDELGLLEALSSGITLIEWPQRIESHLPEAALGVIITCAQGSDCRAITFTGLTDIWKTRLQYIKESQI